MKGIITVVGKDKVGIIAKICTFLSENQINILDISQTILGGYFNMMMIVDLKDNQLDFVATVDALEKLGQEIGVDIRLQHEDLFDSMHRI